jgi:hypothetical protein
LRLTDNEARPTRAVIGAPVTAITSADPVRVSTVYYTSEGREDSIVIPVGAFADPAFPAPTRPVYGRFGVSFLWMSLTSMSAAEP